MLYSYTIMCYLTINYSFALVKLLAAVKDRITASSVFLSTHLSTPKRTGGTTRQHTSVIDLFGDRFI